VPVIPFAKASGCGNDFLLVERADCPAGSDLKQLSIALCDRYEGVGADGVEWISNVQTSTHSLRADLINSDGSTAEISGNGTRCVAAWYLARYQEPSGTVNIVTGAGEKQCRLLSHSENTFEFEMAMGRARNVEERNVAGQAGVVVDLGNPHFVLFVGSYNFDWQELAQRLQSDTGAFPNGTNVEFVRVIDQHVIEAKFFERGAGETRSSGTGSCASAMAAIYSRLCSSPVTVSGPGGSQVIRMEDQLYLRGPAKLICTGEFSISGE
jgi:diaminopimelate epimerase